MPLFDGEHLLGTPDDRPALETVRFNEEAPREAGLPRELLFANHSHVGLQLLCTWTLLLLASIRVEVRKPT
jgi:hypothetical protein